EYLSGFMGNQNGVESLTDIGRSPLHLHQRLAYSFVAGDMLTVVLAGADRVNWCWGITWDKPMPDQVSITTLIRNLNAWRRGAGRPYLVEGRMLKPLPLEGATDIPLFTRHGRAIHCDSLLTSHWESSRRRTAQVIANYTLQSQACRLRCRGTPA